MRKITVFFLTMLLIANAGAADMPKNPIFGERQNQIILNIGQGVNNFGLIPVPEMFVPFNMIQLTYSQPVTVFRLPARQNFSAIQTIGYGSKYQYTDYNGTFEWNWSDYATQIAMISWDVIFLHTERWYFGVGAGVAIQGQQNDREGTKFLLPFKLFTGYRITDGWNIELFTQHFSNGDTGGSANYSYNFIGLGVGYNF